jgi:hypothetical protein
MPELMRLGVVTCVDGVTFGVFCEVVSTYEQVLASPRTGKNSKGRLRNLGECRQAILRYAQEFGLTALARNRLRTPKPEKIDTGKGRFFDQKAG